MSVHVILTTGNFFPWNSYIFFDHFTFVLLSTGFLQLGDQVCYITTLTANQLGSPLPFSWAGLVEPRPNRILWEPVWSCASPWTLRFGFQARAVLLLTGEIDVRVTMIWIHKLFSEALWTNMTEDFFNFRGEMCTYYGLCNFSLWCLGQHPLIRHINTSAGEYMNIPTKWGKCEIKTSGQVSSVITLDQIMVATWVSFGFQWFWTGDLWGRDCGPADQCKSLPFIDHWFVLLLSRVQHFATPWTVASKASLHYLPELAQTHDHWVDDVIQQSHSLSSPSPAFNLSQHQGLLVLCAHV